MCLVKWPQDNRWYRAICVETYFDSHITVLFTDYGNMHIVHIRNVRRLPKLLLFPSLTARCLIQGTK